MSQMKSESVRSSFLGFLELTFGDVLIGNINQLAITYMGGLVVGLQCFVLHDRIMQLPFSFEQGVLSTQFN